MTLRVVREKECLWAVERASGQKRQRGWEKREIECKTESDTKGKRVDLTDTQGAVGRCPAERRGKARKYRPSLHTDSLSLSRHTFAGIIPFLYICD